MLPKLRAIRESTARLSGGGPATRIFPFQQCHSMEPTSEIRHRCSPIPLTVSSEMCNERKVVSRYHGGQLDARDEVSTRLAVGLGPLI